MRVVHAWFVAAGAALAASSASAHVTLENHQATVGLSYKAVFAVPHGCAGSATVKIRVQIPEGVVAAKPMPKFGWNLETIKGKYAAENTIITAPNPLKASRKWCGAAANCRTTITTSSSSAPF